MCNDGLSWKTAEQDENTHFSKQQRVIKNNQADKRKRHARKKLSVKWPRGPNVGRHIFPFRDMIVHGSSTKMIYDRS